MTRGFAMLIGAAAILWASTHAAAQSVLGQPLDSLTGPDFEALARDARRSGDAERGALVFARPELSCRRCHAVGAEPGESPLGPDLARLGPETDAAALVESIAQPSKQIREGFEAVVAALADGRVVTGLLEDETPDRIVLRDADGRLLELDRADVLERRVADQSLMPSGLLALLGTKQEFLDLMRYLIDVAEGGPTRAAELEPDPALIAPRPLPDYENQLDHAGLIAKLDDESYKRGHAIYERVCANCHGTLDREGSLPTAPRFAEAELKNGSDPYSMYQTLTRGFNTMAPQTWMVPREKYDVIHYIREAYFKPHNPAQYIEMDETYLAQLPEGDTFGPEPSQILPWEAMNYGPVLIGTYEVGDDNSNFAHKGIAVRLDPGPGGISRGHRWMIFDHDTMRMAAAWTGEGFIDWQGIHFDGRHNAHPHVVGRVAASNPTGPGWAHPIDGGFNDTRLQGRDGRRYGPLPDDWAEYQGLALHGQRAILHYRVGGTAIREMPGLIETKDAPVFTRTFEIGPRQSGLTLQVARLPGDSAILERNEGAVVFRPPNDRPQDMSTLRDHAHALVAGLIHAPEASSWQAAGSALRLRIPGGSDTLRFTLWFTGLDDVNQSASLGALIPRAQPPDLQALSQGGPARWPEVVTTAIDRGDDSGPFAVDVLTRPAANPWNARVRLSGLDFRSDGDTAVLCTWDGDVWRVEGITADDGELRWRRIASGLFQPLGLKIIEGDIYVTCRDQILVLRDRNNDGEADYYECFNSDHQVTEHFHEFAMDLQVDGDGNFYYTKGGRHALKAVVPHHGTLLRVSPDGERTEIVATGFRAPNGVCLNPDGSFVITDQEGHWTPKNRVNWVEEGGFYGYLWGYSDVTDPSDAAMEPPLCWIDNEIDRSPAQALWVNSPQWGALEGSLLELSYGTGKIMVAPFEEIDGIKQGGVCALPIPRLPTGVMRGRFHPEDGQLYACGLFAWAGDRQQPGGFYRIRATGEPAHVPISLNALSDGLVITFAAPLDPESVRTDRVSIETWSIRRAARYGSERFNEQELSVASARLLGDGRTVALEIPDLEPTRCMLMRLNLRGRNGKPAPIVIQNTIHRLGRESVSAR